MDETQLSDRARQGTLQQQKIYLYAQADPMYFGKPLNPLLRHGPIQTRKCQDIPCCALFFAVWVGVIIISGFSFSEGRPYLLLNPFDSSGYQCGVSPGYEPYPYVYYNLSNNQQFACINACPPTRLKVAQSRCILNATTYNCTAFGSYPTQLIAKVCYPTNSAVSFAVDLGLEIGQEWISDLATTYPATIGVFVLSMLLSIAVLMLTQRWTNCMIWASVVLHLIFLVGLGAVAYVMSVNPHFESQITDYSQLVDPTFLKVVAILCWVVAAVSLLFMLCSIKKMKTAIEVIHTSTKMLAEVPSTILIPLCVCLLLFVVVGYFLTLFVYQFSMGTIVGCTSTPYGCVDWNQRFQRFFGLSVVALLWNCLFVVHFTQYMISAAAAHWYYKSPVRHPICRSLGWMICYHLGSIAFGAVVLSLLSFFRVFMQLLCDRQPKRIPNNANCVKRCCNNMLNCLFCTFHRFLQFVTRNAYIMMAITGQSFCESAHTSFHIIKKHARSYLITHDLSSVLTIFCKLAIAAIASTIGYFVITGFSYFSDTLFSPTMPTLVFFLVSLTIASVFMDVLGNTSDCVLICHLLQREFGQELSEDTKKQELLTMLLIPR